MIDQHRSKNLPIIGYKYNVPSKHHVCNIMYATPIECGMFIYSF